MSATIQPNNPRVFVCREGHVSKEAYGYTHFTCKKIVTEDRYQRPCKLKAMILETEFAHALHQVGWMKRGDRQAMLDQRTDAFVEVTIRDYLNAPEA